MTDARKDIPTPQMEIPPRVLSVGASAARVATELSGEGFLVEHADPDGIPDDAGLLTFDALILDLTPAGLSGAAAAALAQRLARLARETARPLVLGLTERGGPAAGAAATIEADAWIAAGGGGPASLAIEGRIAIRRLAAARREIERLQRAVMHARRTAHDLAQPLTTVLARSQLLLRRLTPDDPNHRALTVLCTEADRLARTVESFQTLRELAPLPESAETPAPPQQGHPQKAR